MLMGMEPYRLQFAFRLSHASEELLHAPGDPRPEHVRGAAQGEEHERGGGDRAGPAADELGEVARARDRDRRDAEAERAEEKHLGRRAAAASERGTDEAGDAPGGRVARPEVREDDEERDDERGVEDPDVDGRRSDRRVREPGDDQEPAADDDRDPEADRLRQRERLREAAPGRYSFISVAIT